MTSFLLPVIALCLLQLYFCLAIPLQVLETLIEARDVTTNSDISLLDVRSYEDPKHSVSGNCEMLLGWPSGFDCLSALGAMSDSSVNAWFGPPSYQLKAVETPNNDNWYGNCVIGIDLNVPAEKKAYATWDRVSWAELKTAASIIIDECVTHQGRGTGGVAFGLGRYTHLSVSVFARIPTSAPKFTTSSSSLSTCEADVIQDIATGSSGSLSIPGSCPSMEPTDECFMDFLTGTFLGDGGDVTGGQGVGQTQGQEAGPTFHTAGGKGVGGVYYANTATHGYCTSDTNCCSGYTCQQKSPSNTYQMFGSKLLSGLGNCIFSAASAIKAGTRGSDTTAINWKRDLLFRS
ncbi:MAG: hypothetical protein M1827_004783 [Pycnora praestabilis]|nr:MAG: hypothetical protein M1827_004783 [Pycnora praestabilis]